MDLLHLEEKHIRFIQMLLYTQRILTICSWFLVVMIQSVYVFENACMAGPSLKQSVRGSFLVKCAEIAEKCMKR